MNLPKIESYGQYSSDNYGAHSLVVEMGKVTVWFSYRTPVAFQVDGQAKVVRDNDWGPTTGKHLNWIDGGSRTDRVPSHRFEELWQEQVLGESPQPQERAAVANSLPTC